MISIQAVTLLLVRPLTTNIDTINVDGHAVNTVVGLTQAVSGQTYNTGDTVNGNNKTNVSLVANGGAEAIVDLNNIASVNVNLTDNSTINGTEFTNVAQVALTSGVGGKALTVNAAQLDTNYAINIARAETLTIGSYAAATGTADTVALSVSGAGLKATAGNRAGFNVAGGNAVEAVTLSTSGTNYVDLAAGTGAKTITVTGAGTNDIALTSAATTYTLDASATTGTNTFNVLTSLTSVDTILGGSGADTLVAEFSKALNYNPTVTGVETLRLTTDVTNTTYNASKTTGITTLTFDDIVDSGNATISNLAATATTVNIGREATIDAGGVTVGYASKSASDVTINLGATSTTADPTVAVTSLTVTGNTGELTVRSTGDAADAGGTIQGALTADSVTGLALVGVNNKLTITGGIEANAANAVLVDGTLKEVSAANGQTVSLDTVNDLTVTSAAGAATLGNVAIDAVAENIETVINLNTGAKALTVGTINAQGAAEYTEAVTLNVNGGAGATTVGAITVEGDAASTAAANVSFTANVVGGAGKADLSGEIKVLSYDKGTADATITVVGGAGLVDLNDTGNAITIDAENKAVNAAIALTSGEGGLNAGTITVNGGATAASTTTFEAEAILGALTVDGLTLTADYAGSSNNVTLTATSANITVTALTATESAAAENALNIVATAASGKSVTITDLADGGGNAADLQSVVTSGAGDVTIGDDSFGNGYDTVVDGTAQTGSLSIDLGSSTGNISVYLGNASVDDTNVVVTGSGNDNIVGGTGADSITGGLNSDFIDVGTGSVDTVVFTSLLTTDEIVNFATGASKDISQYDVSTLDAELAAIGGAGTEAVVDGDGVTVLAADDVSFSDVITIAGDTFAAGNNVFLFSTTTAANTLTAIEASAFAGGAGTPADDDGILYAYVDANADLHIGVAIVQVTGDNIDTAVMNDIAVLTGTYTIAGLNTGNFEFI